MNILKPAELKRNELFRLANSLWKHGVTEIVIHRGEDVQHLRAKTADKWQIERFDGSELLKKRSITFPSI